MLEHLPLLVLEKIVLEVAREDDAHALLLVSKGTLEALKHLGRLPIGCVRTRDMNRVVQRAHAENRVWDIGMCDLSGDRYCLSSTCDLTPLSTCTTIRTLNLSFCQRITDISSLAACVNLHTLSLKMCINVKDVSPLKACEALRVVDLSDCMNVGDISPLAQCESIDMTYSYAIRSVPPLPSCHTLILAMCHSLEDVAGLAECPLLRVLDLTWCFRLTNLSVLEKCPLLHTLSLREREYHSMIGIPKTVHVRSSRKGTPGSMKPQGY